MAAPRIDSAAAGTEPAAATRAASRPEGLIQSRSPLTGELLGEVPVMAPAEVRAMVARARRAQTDWGRLSPRDRAHQLLRFRDGLVDRSEEVVDLLARENGKPRHEGLLHEVLIMAELITHYAKVAPRVLADEERALRLFKYRRSIVRHLPHGVVGVIGPWNFPLQLPMRDAVAALFAGNAVVVKPSEWTPLVMLKAKEIWDSMDLPEDLFGVVTGYGPTGAALVDGGVDFVAFTGAVSTGRRVATACGERLIPCIMELGGKAPLIACSDADVERTAQAVVVGGFANAGQICISVERVYAHRDIYDELVDRVVELTGRLRLGDPVEEEVDLGGITFPRQLEVVEQLVADALAHGAELRCGGKRVEGYESAYEPTVLAGCTHECKVMTEEIFGPIVPFMRVSSADEALSLANDSPMGLNAYVYTEDPARGRRLAERIEAGSVMVNEVLANGGIVEAPFGGIKHSGFGRAMGVEGLLAMTQTRHLGLDRVTLPKQHPLGYPYTPAKYRWLRRGLRALYSPGGAGAKRVLARLLRLG